MRRWCSLRQRQCRCGSGVAEDGGSVGVAVVWLKMAVTAGVEGTVAVAWEGQSSSHWDRSGDPPV